MIEAQQIQDALSPRLGSMLAGAPGFVDPALALLQSFSPQHDTFQELASRLEDVLFNAIYEHLGPGMSARMDDGTCRRIRLAELPEIADDAMGVLFDSPKVYSVSYEALHAYCMKTGSFSAMRCLYLRYESLMSPEERQVLSRIIRGSFPAERWRSFLDS